MRIYRSRIYEHEKNLDLSTIRPCWKHKWKSAFMWSANRTLNIFSTSITSVQLMNFRFYYSFRNHWAFYHYCCIHHINHDFIKFRHLATCTMIVRHNMGTILTSLPLEMMVNKMLTRNSNHFHSEPEFIVQSNIWKKIISKYFNISWPNERVNCGVNGPMNIFSRYFVHNMCKCIWNFRYFVISIKI